MLSYLCGALELFNHFSELEFCVLPVVLKLADSLVN